MNTKNDNVENIQNTTNETRFESTKDKEENKIKVKKSTTTKKKSTKKTEIKVDDATNKKSNANAKSNAYKKTKKVNSTDENEKTTKKNEKTKTVVDDKNTADTSSTVESITESLDQHKTRDEAVNVAAAEIIEENKENDSITLNANEKIEVDVDNEKRFKLFFVSDMDEEATYLHEMSLQGYHFINKKGMQYFFEKGEPINYYYHLGYHEKDKQDGSRYLDIYAEAGWDNIYHEKAEFDGIWNYFRIKMADGAQEPNIFSDRTSRLSLYKRLLSAWRSLLALDIICFLCMLFVYSFLNNHPGKLTASVMSLCAVLIILIIVIFIIYLRAYLKISKKQTELQNL